MAEEHGIQIELVDETYISKLALVCGESSRRDSLRLGIV
ncbi:hypothetical protein [Thermococcus sp.]